MCLQSMASDVGHQVILQGQGQHLGTEGGVMKLVEIEELIGRN